MAEPDAFCGGGEVGHSQTLVVGGRGGVLMAVPEVGRLFGEEVLMAVTEAGCGGKEEGFSWQSQMLVVRGRGVGSHGTPRRWFGGERRGFSWQSESLVVGGQAVELMAVPDAGSEGERRGFSLQSQKLVVEGERQGFSCQSQTLPVKGRGRGSHNSNRSWLGGGDWFSWQSQTLVVGVRRSKGSHGRLRHWLLWGGDGTHCSPRHRLWRGRGRGSHVSPRRCL